MNQEGSLERRVRSGLAWSTVNNLFVRLGNVLVSVVVARLLAPEEFGVFAVALAVVIILGTFADLGMSAYLVRSPDLGARAPTVATLGVTIGLILGGLMLVSAGSIASAFGSPAATPVIQLLAVSVVLSGFGVVPAAVMQREFLQARQLVVDVVSLVISTGVTVVLVESGVGALSLAWARIISQVVGIFLQFRLSGTRPRFGFRRDLLGDAVHFGLPLAGANFLSWLLLSVDTLVVGRTAGPLLLGFYALAFNVSGWPINAIGQSVRVVALPGFSRQSHRPPGEAFVPAAAVTWAVALPVGLLLGLLGVPLVAFLYGERWVPAAAALAGLGLFGALRVGFDLTATFAVARGATHAVMWVQVWWMVILIPAMYVGVDRGGLAGAGWAHVTVAVVAVLPAYLLLLSRLGVPPAEVLRRCARPTLAALPASAAAVAATTLTDSRLLSLVAGGAAFCAVYVPLVQAWVRRQVAWIGSGPPLPFDAVPPPADGRDEEVAVTAAVSSPRRGRHLPDRSRRAPARLGRVSPGQVSGTGGAP